MYALHPALWRSCAFIIAVGALTTAVCLPSRAQTATAPTVIRVSFRPNAAFDDRTPLDFTGVESKAASANSAFGSNGSNTWNYLSANPTNPGTPATVNPSFPNLLDSTGASTSVGISFVGNVGGAIDVPYDNNGSDALENEYFLVDAGVTSATDTYSITGLPANTTVALFLYAPNFGDADSGNPVDDGNRSYILTVNGTKVNVNSGPSNDALAYVTTDASGKLSGEWSTVGNEGDWSGFQIAYPVAESVAPATFFNGEANLGEGTYYLSFASGNYFGYYSFLTDPHYIYHFDLGYEYVFDAGDNRSGVYFYDFKSKDFFYTSPTFPFPYLFDFNLNTVLYYYPDPNNAGRYNTDGIRYFYDFAAGQIITK